MCGDESDCKVNQKASGLRNNRIVIAVVSLVVVVLGAVLYVFYRNAQSDKEESAYEFALSSNDPQVLQNYLNTYTDAPEAHRDSISAHLEYFAQLDRDWTNVVVSGSKSDFQRYIEQHPNSPFCQVAQHKIDSIDWSRADAANTLEAVQLYLE
jgi:outer membrane protein assembly factor BamD (BamD/ComL family)